MYPILLLLITPAIGSEVIEIIELPDMPENKVQCSLNNSKNQCPGRRDIWKIIIKDPFKRKKAEVDSFITFFLIDYQVEMWALLSEKYWDEIHLKHLWSNGRVRLFDRVFCGMNIEDYIIKTGYIWWPTVIGLSRKENVSIWKSDDCDEKDHCVQVACCLPGPLDLRPFITLLRNTNPYIDLMIFTAAAYKGVEKKFSSHQLTYNLTGGFLKGNSYVTVLYKSTARDYKIENIEMIYYSLKSNGPLELIDVCDNVTKLPDLDQDWKCDIRSKDSPSCSGEKEFRELRINAADKSKQTALLQSVINNKKYKDAITSYLGDNLLSKLRELWFSDHGLFKNVFVDDDTRNRSKVKSGYLTLQYGDMKCEGPILDDVRPSNCTAVYPDIYQFRSLEGMAITTFDKVNPLFDFTALTLAAARGRLLMNLAPGKTVTLVAKSSDECKIAFDVLSLKGKQTEEGDWIMTNFSVSYRF